MTSPWRAQFDLDATSTEPVAVDWFLAANSIWADKAWWANAEYLAKVADKGTEWKCAFHLVRALVNILKTLERLDARST